MVSASPTDVEDLASQMVRLYRDPTLRAALACRASEEYAPITWDVMKARYLQLMDTLSAYGTPSLSNRRRQAPAWLQASSIDHGRPT